MLDVYDYIFWSVISCIMATLLFTLILVGIYSLYLMCRSSSKKKNANGGETTTNANNNMYQLKKVKSVYDLSEENVRRHEELMGQSGPYFPTQKSSAHVLFYLGTTSASGTDESENLYYPFEEI